MMWYMVSSTTSLQISEIKTSYPHSYYEKSIIERTIQYIKKCRTESFDDYSHAKKIIVNYNTLKIGLICLLVDIHNGMIIVK